MDSEDIDPRKQELINSFLQVDDEAAVRYRISRSEEDVRNGDTLTQEEAEQESENWGK